MTGALENYLEAVSFLADEGEVRVTGIASRVGVSKPSVLTALKTLEDRGLLEHRRYGAVSLTAAGELKARAIRERHSFLSAFLRDILGVSRENAEKDACRMEHFLSEETLLKIKAITKSAAGGKKS